MFQVRRIKYKYQVKDVIREGIPNTKGLLKSYMETYYCRSFLKYIYIGKEMESPSYGETMPILDTLCVVKPPVPGMDYVLLSHWLKGSP